MDNEVDAFFEHHGIKGQHWGVINKKINEKITEHKDNQWKKKVNKKHGDMNVRIAMSRKMRDGIRKLEESSKYKNLDIDALHDEALNEHLHKYLADPKNYKYSNNPYSVNPKKYGILDDWHKDVEALQKQSHKEAVKEVHGVSPSGKYKAVADLNTSSHLYPKVKIVSNKVKHDNKVDAFFEHYGIKGMHRKSTLPEKLTRIARVAFGTEFKSKNLQNAVKEKLKAMKDAIKEQEKKEKEYEDALLELSKAKEKESEDKTSSDFIKEQASSSVKDFVSTEDEPVTTSNE